MEGRSVNQAGASFPGEASSVVPGYEKWECPVCKYEQWRSPGVECKRCGGVGSVFGVGDVVRCLGSDGVPEMVITKVEFNSPRNRWEYTGGLGGWYSQGDFQLVRRAVDELPEDGGSEEVLDLTAPRVPAAAVGGSGGAGDGGISSVSGSVDTEQPRSASGESAPVLSINEEIKR